MLAQPGLRRRRGNDISPCEPDNSRRGTRRRRNQLDGAIRRRKLTERSSMQQRPKPMRLLLHAQRTYRAAPPRSRPLGRQIGPGLVRQFGSHLIRAWTGGCKTAGRMAVIEIPFVARGIPGRAVIQYGVNDDPSRWGYRLVGVPFDIECARGCPVMEATVAYPAEGYAAQLGWIQIIRYGVPGGAEVAMVDAPPQLADAGTPWAAWGVRPTLFDAPSTSEFESGSARRRSWRRRLMR